MDLSNVKLVATDMDGTLLNSRHELSADFFDLFRQLKERHMLFAVASGRQFHNLRSCMADVQDEVIFIAENGSYVVYQNEEVLVQALAPEVVHELVLAARQIPDTYLILCGKKTAYIDNTTPHFVEHVRLYYDRHQLVDDLLQVTDDAFLKLAIWDQRGAEANSYRHFQHRQQELQVTVSGHSWLDIAHKLASKGRALAAVQQRCGIAPEQTMVFGDYLNDLDMMPQAHFSFAMANAHPAIKEAARYQAKSNDEHGVQEMLHHLVAALN